MVEREIGQIESEMCSAYPNSFFFSNVDSMVSNSNEVILEKSDLNASGDGRVRNPEE